MVISFVVLSVLSATTVAVSALTKKDGAKHGIIHGAQDTALRNGIHVHQRKHMIMGIQHDMNDMMCHALYMRREMIYKHYTT